MGKVTPILGQTIWDLAMQEHGSIETAFGIIAANLNVEISLDANLPMVPLSIPAVADVAAADNDLVDVLRRSGITTFTGVIPAPPIIDWDEDDFNENDWK